MGFFGHGRCCDNRCCQDRCCENRERDCHKEKDSHKEDCHEKQCCPCCCVNCIMRKKPCHCPREVCCNSYPEPIHDECDDEFEICCW